jgi:urease accessory protein
LTYGDGLAIRLVTESVGAKGAARADPALGPSGWPSSPSHPTPDPSLGDLSLTRPRSAAGPAAAPAEDTVWEIDRRLFAQTLPQQIRQANLTMGRRLVEIALITTDSRWVAAYSHEIERGHCHGHPAVALSLVGLELGAPPGVIVAWHLQAVATSLTQNAVRAIPLGQNAGQRALADCRPHVSAAVDRVQRADRRDFGAIAPGLEIAQMRHERLTHRMYRS